MKAHDVCRIRRCPLCSDFGDRCNMLSDGPNCIHGRCAIDERGIEQVAATFPIEQVIALQRSDIGDDGSRPRYYRCVLDNLAPHH